MAELKSHTAKFFEVLLKMQETQEDGTEKMVKKMVAVDALSFGDAESKAIEEFSISSELSVININPAAYGEVFSSDADDDELYFKAKLEFITIDEKSEKEKRSKITYLVQAKTIARALRYIDDVMGKTMIDYDSVSVVATGISDCLFHKDKDENEQN